MNEYFGPPFSANVGYVEEMFARYQNAPGSVGPEWRAYFEGFHEGFGVAVQLGGDAVGQVSMGHSTSQTTPSSQHSSVDLAFEMKVASLVQAYKANGHLAARLNPLHIERPKPVSLALASHGLAESDLQRSCSSASVHGLAENSSLAQVVAHFEGLYCSSVGAEIEHISNPAEREWLHKRIAEIHTLPDAQTRQSLFRSLAKADALEKSIAAKYIGKKRFSIEGADAQIAALETVLDRFAEKGTKGICIGMAHRGRLNTLVNIVGKPLADLCAEFEGYPNEEISGDWDVKYHFGYESERTTRNGHKIRVSLACNPSHLEFVDAVVVGQVRAQQDKFYQSNKDAVVPVILHGDAAIAGQGIVYEVIGMMNLDGYTVGGSLHLVTNNQVGFTTSPRDSRSSEYCTDIAKVVEAPVLHVNANDIDALHNVMTLAVDYRSQFHKDVFVDLICFRRHGHNENEDAFVTQPVLYKIIKEKQVPWQEYAEKLSATHQKSELEEIYAQIRSEMNEIFDKAKADHHPITVPPKPRGFENYLPVGVEEMLKPVATNVAMETLKNIGKKIFTIPEDFQIYTKLARIYAKDRMEMVDGLKPIDWGTAELLAYGSLLSEGYSVRLTGQDARQGTFSHRHAALTDFETGRKITPLSWVTQQGAKFEVFDSHLSETGAMGYEYGFATQHDKALVLWEGQFGDFGNGAQVIIDQFIAAGESKWLQNQGLVLLLPHGYEGQGPEHSSARLERFLQLCAQGNMQVCYFTSGAQLFHALRRQMKAPFRKPLVVMSPKSFLRNPRSSCSLEDLASGRFYEVRDDSRKLEPAAVTKVVLCSGKIRIDLLDAIEKQGSEKFSHVAVVSLEQLYPFPESQLTNVLKTYGKAKSIVWAQEEPRNTGASFFVRDKIEKILQSTLKVKPKLGYIGRSERASPAVGLEKQHLVEQEKIIAACLGADEQLEV